MIKLENISFSYGEKPVLKNFSLEIGDGERICLSGKSGSGKTTVARLILGLEQPQSGQITGTEGLMKSVVFQENRLLPFYTVLQNITLIGASPKTALNQLSALGISDSAKQYPNALSGGMQRRAAIARALSAAYDFLILDEPFTGLDQENMRLAAAHILKEAGRRPILLISHSSIEADLLGAKSVEI